MATIAAPEHAQPQALTAASWRALIASFLGWMFDGYETYALILVAGVALRQLLLPDQLASIPIYIGGLLAVTLVGWATGGIIAGVLADYIGRKRMMMLSILWYALFTGAHGVRRELHEPLDPALPDGPRPGRRVGTGHRDPG